MTALRVAARPEQDASPRPVPWRRMAWVTWRQHRFALAGVAVLLGGLAVWLWLEGLAAHRAYAAAAPPARSRTRARGRCRGGGWPGSPGGSTGSRWPGWPCC